MAVTRGGPGGALSGVPHVLPRRNPWPQVNFFARDEHDALPNYKLLQSGLNSLNITRVRVRPPPRRHVCGLHGSA